MREKVDWGKIKSEYVTNDGVTLKYLANKYSLSFGYLQRKSAEDGWKDSRVKYRSRVEEKIEEELAIDAAGERTKLIKIGKTLMAIGLRGITGKNPRFEPKNFKDSLKAITTGARIISNNLPKLGNN